MKNNKGFTLIELLAVIVVLAIVMVLAATTVLPYMANARENAFKVEATNVVKAAENAKNLYSLGQVTIGTGKDAANSCVQGTTMCFTVADLISLGLFDADASVYSGMVKIDTYNTSPSYTLNLKKNDEFKIVDGKIGDGTVKDYSKYTGSLTSGTWTAGTTDKCTCSQ